MSVKFTTIGFCFSLLLIENLESVYAQGPQIDIPIDSLTTDLPERVTGEITLYVFNTGSDTLEFDVCEVNCEGGDYSWLNLLPTSGLVISGDSIGIKIELDFTEVSQESLYANLLVRSNDPDTPNYPIRIEISLIGTVDSEVSSLYARPGIDSLYFIADMREASEINGNPHIEIFSSDSDLVDILELFDDGLHSDLDSVDKMYGNSWISDPDEEYIYNTQLTWLTRDGFSLFIWSCCEFTTMGPSVFDAVVPFNQDTVLNPGELYGFRYALKNEGIHTTILDVSADISSSSDCIEDIHRSEATFGMIAPGESVLSQLQAIETSENCSTLQDIKFDIDISSEGVSFWSDSFRIELIPVGVGDEVASIPNDYFLSQSFPNPFNAIATIHYALPKSSDVSLVIYNLKGQEIVRWDEQNIQPGYYEKTWRGINKFGVPIGSGVYLYRLMAGNFVQTRKMVLLK